MKYIAPVILFAFLLTACASGANVPSGTPTLDPVQQTGRDVFNLRCAQCHALTPDTIVIGPSLAGVATRAATRIDGYTAEEYIEDSILHPKHYIVEGFTDTMPTNFGKDLTNDELKGVVAFLMTLK